jgi:hypothetical protein
LGFAFALAKNNCACRLRWLFAYLRTDRKFFALKMKQERAPAAFFGSHYLHPRLLCLPLYHHSPQQRRKPQARVAQLVERDLAKVEVASSNLVSRSKQNATYLGGVFGFIPFRKMAAPRKCLSTDEGFWAAVAESLSERQELARIGLLPAGGNYKTVQSRIRQLGLDMSHFRGAGWNVGARYKAFGRKAALEEILIENSTYAFTHGLRGRLLKEGLKQH